MWGNSTSVISRSMSPSWFEAIRSASKPLSASSTLNPARTKHFRHNALTCESSSMTKRVTLSELSGSCIVIPSAVNRLDETFPDLGRNWALSVPKSRTSYLYRFGAMCVRRRSMLFVWRIRRSEDHHWRLTASLAGGSRVLHRPAGPGLRTSLSGTSSCWICTFPSVTVLRS